MDAHADLDLIVTDGKGGNADLRHNARAQCNAHGADAGERPPRHGRDLFQRRMAAAAAPAIL